MFTLETFHLMRANAAFTLYDARACYDRMIMEIQKKQINTAKLLLYMAVVKELPMHHWDGVSHHTYV
eukprot:8879030-Ditylum_brightwellii.AAC.1